MTYSPKPDQQQVLQESAHLTGFTANFYQTIPDEVTTRTSGGADVSTTSQSAKISVGPNSGDVGYIAGPGSRNDTYAELPYRLEVVYSRKRGDSIPLTDTVLIGFAASSDFSRDRHAALDLTAQEFKVDGATAGTTSLPPNSEELAYLSLTSDRGSGITRFRHVIPSENIVDTAEIADGSVFANGMFFGGQSNGNDEGVEIYNIKYGFTDDAFTPPRIN